MRRILAFRDGESEKSLTWLSRRFDDRHFERRCRPAVTPKNLGDLLSNLVLWQCEGFQLRSKPTGLRDAVDDETSTGIRKRAHVLGKFLSVVVGRHERVRHPLEIELTILLSSIFDERLEVVLVEVRKTVADELLDGRYPNSDRHDRGLLLPLHVRATRARTMAVKWNDAATSVQAWKTSWKPNVVGHGLGLRRA